MKKIILFFVAVLFAGVSCTKTERLSGGGEGAAEREVEISISTRSSSTRTPVPDEGMPRERQIDELDLLIFKGDAYQYRRRAFRISEGKYKANLKIDDAFLTAYVFANCGTSLETWEKQTDRTGTPWEDVQKALTDANPSRLVSDQGEILPMWGKTSGYVSETGVTGWENVSLLRSVASVDLYVEHGTGTSKFILTDAHLWYAPNKGYLAPVPNGTGYLLTSPDDMETTLNTLVTSHPVQGIYENSQGVEVTKDALAGRLYLYDNDIHDGNFSPDNYPIRKYSRLIVAGYYDQPDPIYEPGDPGVDKRKKTYYPLDFVGTGGKFRPIVRNYKYVFNITNVAGPGYETKEEAADEYPINMEVNVIDWNMDDVEIGVQGKYYLSMERKHAWLWRYAGSTEELRLTYQILDQTPGASFALDFTTTDNGVQTTTTSGDNITIRNDYFEVTLLHDTVTSTAQFIVKALQDYTSGHDTDLVEIRFRDLRFYVKITHRNSTEEDWNNGGEIPGDL